MSLQLVKFEKSDAWFVDAWAVVNTVMDTVLPQLIFDELQGLLLLEYINVNALRHDSREQKRICDLLLRWLDDVAPHASRHANAVRILPRAWAEALVDTDGWDEEALAQLELDEADLIETLAFGKQEAFDYLIEQFGEWEPEKKGQAK